MRENKNCAGRNPTRNAAVRALSIGLLCSFSIMASPVLAQSIALHPLDDDGVQAAIDEGSSNALSASCTANPGMGSIFGNALTAAVGGGTTYTGGYSVTFLSHYGQIATVKSERERRYMPPPTPSDIPNELREPRLHLWIEPDGDSDGDNLIELSASIEHVVIRPEDRTEGVIQPIDFTTEPVTFRNLLGAEYVATRALATFPADSALEAAADRDLEVVVITPAGERRCNVDNDRIYRMFHLERP